MVEDGMMFLKCLDIKEETNWKIVIMYSKARIKREFAKVLTIVVNCFRAVQFFVGITRNTKRIHKNIWVNHLPRKKKAL